MGVEERDRTDHAAADRTPAHGGPDPRAPEPRSSAARAGDDDRPATELDDELDREELRERYYGLLQELRVLLPGVQILVAFLLTVPFASGFDRLDETGRDLYGISLVSGTLAVIAFAAPTVFHRVGRRQSRSARLAWGIRTTRLGLVLFAISLIAGLVLVARIVLRPGAAALAIGIVVVGLVAMWIVLPLMTSPRRR